MLTEAQYNTMSQTELAQGTLQSTLSLMTFQYQLNQHSGQLQISQTAGRRPHGLHKYCDGECEFNVKNIFTVACKCSTFNSLYLRINCER
jgi:hypothetical protein